ncbi:MAG: sodium-extruding oxaloacetate decarboxylase subunit alpha [Bacteroides sp.]|nr:sodium-extruding oxaloacetate decarboxylase subunit alpha [Prevotella sp.]MCM1407481.1 sodium-extruding oxaloacetate decarboxylase subunit alpha [Treponema brennaborense]MCM1469971.1 sodium-extruding oxaloacetate decarboxylase subunit alpha [Bacteroides sp.]
MAGKIGISDLVLRDAHQSLHATRMTTADMLPVCDKLDKIGYVSLEAWGGATYDSCISFLNEDPWERLRKLHAALPNTPIMMLLRGQNLLGYRHYADDVVDKFVETSAANGIGVFRIFDACNDPRNLKRAADAAKKTGKHVQMAISYAVTPYHTNEKYAELAKVYADFGADSICIKDMSGLLRPYDVYDLVKAIKAKVDIPVQIHTHATTGMSVATLVKAAEAGADVLDTTISSMSMTTSHSPTESIVEIFRGTPYDTGLDLKALVEIGDYFRDVRAKYAKFESALKGVKPQILVSQVPGGMLSNLENQLKEQNAIDKMDEVLKEIPLVHKDVGYVPLVTPTSQIVGVQAVLNVLQGRYKLMTPEFQSLLTGKYGKLPAAPNADLVKFALEKSGMQEPVNCRPADEIPMEWDKMVAEAAAAGGNGSTEDVLTYAMFPKKAEKFFKERASGPVSSDSFVVAAPKTASGSGNGSYVISVNGTNYNVSANASGDKMAVTVDGTKYDVVIGASASGVENAAPAAQSSGGTTIAAPVAGTILKLIAGEGASVKSGDTIIMIESMKMELDVKATANGTVHFLASAGASISAGQPLAEIK